MAQYGMTRVMRDYDLYALTAGSRDRPVGEVEIAVPRTWWVPSSTWSEREEDAITAWLAEADVDLVEGV